MTDALRQVAGDADRIVVVDTETTGVYPSDRVVEIALVTLSLNGEVLDAWDTLVHPEPDVSASHIHGITASMVAQAPTFADLAGDIAVRLRGACVAAHNVAFDGRMLAGELDRTGGHLALDRGIDTLRATGAKLAIACQAHDVALDGAHRALSDATATANLLCRVAPDCHPGSPVSLVADSTRHGRVLRRDDSNPTRMADPPLIAYLASQMPHTGVDVDLLAYLDMIDLAVEDLHLDRDERRELATLAHQLGLSDDQIVQARRRFVNELVDTAVEDHKVTAEEYETLVRVAAALEVDQAVVDQRTRPYRSTGTQLAVTPGLTVVFTGEHPHHRREDLTDHATVLELEVGRSVTKTTDLVIAADIESTSGKATKARRYNIPIASADNFANLNQGALIDVVGASIDARKVITCPDCLNTWTVPANSGEHTSKRCTLCAPLRQPPLRSPAPRASKARTERLRCQTCGETLSRQQARGRKAGRCPACSA